MTLISVFVVVILASMSNMAEGSYRDLFTRDTTHDILRRLDELEDRNREQQTELDRLKTENAFLRESNVILAKSIEHLRERGSQLTDRIKLLEDLEKVGTAELVEESRDQTNSTGHMSRIPNGYLEKELDSMKDNGKARGIISSDETNKSDLSLAHNRIRQLEQGSTIAFLASRSSSHAEHLGKHQAIVFERTITNVGQAYDNSTGTFISPVSGIYVFSVTILTKSEAAHFQFTINGQAYTIMYAHGTETYETLSQTVIFKLSKGDDVSVQSLDSDKFVHGYDYSTFSGFLLVTTDGDVFVG